MPCKNWIPSHYNKKIALHTLDSLFLNVFVLTQTKILENADPQIFSLLSPLFCTYSALLLLATVISRHDIDAITPVSLQYCRFGFLSLYTALLVVLTPVMVVVTIPKITWRTFTYTLVTLNQMFVFVELLLGVLYPLFLSAKLWAKRHQPKPPMPWATCPVSRELIQEDPRILLPDGTLYDRSTVDALLANGIRCSPTTRRPITRSDFCSLKEVGDLYRRHQRMTAELETLQTYKQSLEDTLDQVEKDLALLLVEVRWLHKRYNPLLYLLRDLTPKQIKYVKTRMKKVIANMTY